MKGCYKKQNSIDTIVQALEETILSILHLKYRECLQMEHHSSSCHS